MFNLLNEGTYVLVNRMLLLTVVSLSVWLGYWVFRSDRKRRSNQLFFLMSVLLGLWPAFGYLTFFSEQSSSALFWDKWAYATVSLFTIVFYSFFAYFFEEQNRFKIFKYFTYIIGTLFLLLSFFTDLIVKKIIIEGTGVKPVFNVGAFIFYLYVLVVFIFVFYRFFQNFKSSDHGQKAKILYFFIGTSVFLLLNTVFNIIVPILSGTYELHQLGNYASIILLGFTAYAISRHRLFDIRVIATETLTILIWVVLFVKLFVSQTAVGVMVDLITFILVVVFGVMLIRSIRKEVEQREKLQELTDKLKAMDEQKDTFISMAAHELRAPMTAIKGYISMILEGDAGDITDKARGYLADTNAINERLIRLVNNMLNVSRIEEGRMVYQVEVVNLAEVVRTIFSQFRPEAERKGLKLSSDIPMEIKDRVEVDPDRIQEVIGNFMSNAVKYTNEGSVILRLKQPDENKVRLEVTDTGPGISSAEQAKLFNKFYRAESTVGKTIGTGLGLYISKLLIERFGGKIGLVSDVGKGSTFWFELPLKEENATQHKSTSDTQSKGQEDE